MAQRMVKTSRVLASRRFLKLVYITILALITLVLVVISLIIIEERNLKDEDVQRYEQILSISENYNQQISDLQVDISDTKLLIAELQPTDYNSRLDNLAILISYYHDITAIADESINELKISEGLNIPETDKDSVRISIKILRELKSKTNSAVNSAKNERNVIQYFIELQKSISCIDQIDTDQSSERISSDFSKCAEFLDSARSNMNTINYNFSETNIYLEGIASFWETNIELHRSIELQNEELAGELAHELNSKEDSLPLLEDSSSKEIEDFLEFNSSNQFSE